ncbi:hypothetical protein C8R44DRAFT_549161, partial [Mycena epipterygia]
MAVISPVAVNMATVVLESLLYGLILVLFSANMYLRITRYARPRQLASCGALRWNPIVISNIAIFVTCTVHWIITVKRFFLAFLGSAGDPLIFYMDECQPTSVASNTLTIVAALGGDAVIIHRLWLVWNRDLRLVFIPVLSWLGLLSEVSFFSGKLPSHWFIASGIAFIYLFTQSSPGNDKFLTAGGAWVAVNWTLTTLYFIPNSAFIAWRIWKTKRATSEVGGGLLLPVFVILIESAAIWTAWAVFFVVTYLMSSTLQFIVRDLTPSIIGLANLLIHLRVGLGWS